MKCRCGHGRGFHYPSANAKSKRRAWGSSPRLAKASCHFGWRPGGRKLCPCRDWHPEGAR